MVCGLQYHQPKVRCLIVDCQCHTVQAYGCLNTCGHDRCECCPQGIQHHVNFRHGIPWTCSFNISRKSASVAASRIFIPNRLVVGIFTYVVKVTQPVTVLNSTSRLHLEIIGLYTTTIKIGTTPTMKVNISDPYVALHNTEAADDELARMFGSLNV